MRKLSSGVSLFPVLGMLVFSTPLARAVDYTWDGGGDAISWSDPLNWTADAGFPNVADTATFNSPAVNLDGVIPSGFVTATIQSGIVHLNNLANTIPSGTFVVEAGAGLNVVTEGGASALNGANVSLNGGTLEFAAGSPATFDGLEERWYNITGSDALIDPLTTANSSSLLNQTPVVIQTLDVAIDFPNDTAMNDRSGGLGGRDDISALWLGDLHVGVNGSALAAGDISFGTRSDDGSVLFIDGNNNGVFESPEEMVVNNKGLHGAVNRTGTTNLLAGVYGIGIACFERGGGGAMHARIFQGATNNYDAMTLIDPTDPGQTNAWTFTPAIQGALGNDVTVTADSSIVLGADLSVISLQNLSMSGDVALTIDSVEMGQSLSFTNSVSIDGVSTFRQIGMANVILPQITEVGASAIVQDGDGKITFTAANTYTGTTTINGGVLIVNANGGLGDIAAGTLVNTNGALVIDGAGNLNYADAEPLELHGHGNAKQFGAFSHAGGNNDDFRGPITLGSDATIYHPANVLSLFGLIDNAGFELSLVSDGGNLEIEGSGGITGAGDVVADGVNGRVITFNNTKSDFDGLLTINNIIWDARSNDSLGSTNGATVVNSGGRLELRDGKTWGDDITIFGSDNNAGAIRSENNLNTLTGDVTLAGPSLIHVNATQLTLLGDLTGPYQLTKKGVGTLILDGDKTVDQLVPFEGAVRINSEGGLGGTADFVLPQTATLELSNGVSFDGSGTLQSIIAGGGAVSVLDGVSILSLPIQVDSAAGITFGGAGDLIVESDIGATGATTNQSVYALSHFGFHTNVQDSLDLDNNGGILGSGEPTNSPAFFNETTLTIGPNGRGLDFDADADFVDSGAVGQIDNYQNLWIGYLHCDQTGTWSFRNADDDDRAGIWIDLNTNGLFESSTPGLGDNRREQVSWENTGTKNVSLTNGVVYLIAFTHMEFSGNSRADFRFTRPGSTFQEIVHPVRQAGLWSPLRAAGTVANNSLAKTGSGTVFLNGDNNYAGGTSIAGGRLVPVDVDAIGGVGSDVSISGGTLILSGGIALDLGSLVVQGDGDVARSGAVLNLDGDNTLSSTNLTFNPPVISGSTVTFGSDDGTLTVDGAELNLEYSALRLAGAGDVVFNSAVLSSQTDSLVTTNALAHFGFHNLLEDDLNLDQNGGLMGGGDPQSNPDFFGATLLTDGPGNRGLDFDNDNDFRNTGAVNQNDNYSNLFLGELKCNQTGDWGFRNAGQDDRAGIWLDLNQNGVFESSIPGLGDNRGEQLSWQNGGNKQVTLTAGRTYLIAFTHKEFGGGSRCDFRFTPPGGSEVIIKPTDPAQAGLWQTPEVVPSNQIVKEGAGTAFLNGVNAHIGETFVLGGTLVIPQAAALGTVDAGTFIEGGTLALDGGVVLNGEALGLDGDITALSGANQIAATSVISVSTNATRVGIGAQGGSLAVDGDIDLQLSALEVGGDGDTTFAGVISGLGAGFVTIPPLPAVYDFEENVHPLYDISLWEVVKGFAGSHTQAVNDIALTAGSVTGNYAHDAVHSNCLVSSPPFTLDGSGDPITFELTGGMATGNQGANSNELPTNVSEVLAIDDSNNLTGVQGVGLRRIDTGEYVVSSSKSTNGANNEPFSWDTTGLPDTTYVFDFFDYYHGGWGWMDLDNVVIPGLDLNQAEAVNNQLTKSGAGDLTLNGDSTYDGPTIIDQGTVFANGSLATGTSNVTVLADGVLAGNGTVGGAVLIDTRGVLSAGSSPGALAADGAIQFADYSSVFLADLDGPTTPGTDYDEVVSPDVINLNNATLVLRRDPGYTPVNGQALTIGLSSAGIVGTFNGLPEGALVSAEGAQFTISYLNNSITLTAGTGLEPYAGPDTISRRPGMSVTTPESNLLSNDLGGDGAGPLVVTAVSPTSLAGGTVTVSGGMITYTPPAAFSGDDSFTYTLSDGTETSVGLVTVREVAADAGPAVGIVAGLIVLPNGDYRVAFTGDPDTAYDVQFTTNLLATPISWTFLETVQSDSSGDISYDHANPPEPIAYYRAIPQ